MLDWLREHEHRTGTKEGCRAGDCGACTVVAGELADDGGLVFRPVDSCITPLVTIDGLALWTVEDLACPDGDLHPVQRAIIDHHATQCGFCTPGVVMSLFALYQQHMSGARAAPRLVSRSDAVTALAGNLCRCTGYQPILDAAEAMVGYPPMTVDETALVDLLRSIQPSRDLESVLRSRRDRPQAVVVAGGTDVMVDAEALGTELVDVVLLRGVPELTGVEDDGDRLVIGAAVPLEDAWAALARERPGLSDYARRFGGPQVRGAGTLGGNIVTGSPVGDSMPVLLALGATLRLASLDTAREVPLGDFVVGYRSTDLRPDELLVAIVVPHPRPGELFFARKHSRRHDDDISAVSLAVRLVERNGLVADASVGVGGAAAVPCRAPETEAALVNRPWSWASACDAAEVLRRELDPIDDVRASARHRRDELAALLRSGWDGARS